MQTPFSTGPDLDNLHTGQARRLPSVVPGRTVQIDLRSWSAQLRTNCHQRCSAEDPAALRDASDAGHGCQWMRVYVIITSSR